MLLGLLSDTATNICSRSMLLGLLSDTVTNICSRSMLLGLLSDTATNICSSAELLTRRNEAVLATVELAAQGLSSPQRKRGSDLDPSKAQVAQPCTHVAPLCMKNAAALQMHGL